MFNRESLNCNKLFSSCDRSYVTLFLKVWAAKIFSSKSEFVGSGLVKTSLQTDHAVKDRWNCSRNWSALFLSSCDALEEMHCKAVWISGTWKLSIAGRDQ